MKPSVSRALQRLDSYSTQVDRLLQSVSAGAESADVESLKSTISSLTQEVSYLRMALLDTDENSVSDEDREQFSAAFNTYLETCLQKKPAKIVFATYSREFFLRYSKKARIEIAKALLNFCARHNLVAPALCSDIIASSGAL